ncbi:MAG: hypothetical protein CVT92_15085 [Bacteroidetes bacterium HGW-Bacteroidetes-1]|jgi:Tat protein translocase TatB subunit|nr:MAG: hypothetical protein CVT92_15085 [Bacteroidetes bacterium HGW-Bacteroidetes-1]
MLLFLDFGSGEIILILLVLFVVLGPQKLPEVARTLGKTINEMKRASAGFKNEINKEVQKLERETRYNDFLNQKEQQKTVIEETVPTRMPDNTEQISNKKNKQVTQAINPEEGKEDTLTDEPAQ